MDIPLLYAEYLPSNRLHRAAIVYSLIASCKAADVDPRQWMEDVLVKISIYKKENKNLSELLPRNWKNLLPRK
ncbi:MAG: transposase domain-containing protein [Paludibacteraceae bacterium]|nr:transposase domain-containing protein [Paludibacteraceae bacterium]